MGRRALIPALLASAWAMAATREQVEFYEKQVRPLFAVHCYSCHSTQAKTRFAGLSLDTAAGVQRGSDSGAVIVPGRPRESKLIQAVSGCLPLKMPPTGKLSDEQIATLVRWVEMGAALPEEAAAPAYQAFDLERRRREHWAWQPVKAVEPPRAPLHPNRRVDPGSESARLVREDADPLVRRIRQSPLRARQ